MTKKLFILVTFIMLALTSAHAQREVYYRCTGNNVNVRKGPGTKYGKVMSVGGAKCPMGAMQLFKGNIVVGNGVKRNGFIHIDYFVPTPCIDRSGQEMRQLQGQGRHRQDMPGMQRRGLRLLLQQHRQGTMPQMRRRGLSLTKIP